MRSVPLPFTCGHKSYLPGAENDHGNDDPDWADPVSVACFSWDPSSSELLQTGDTVAADRVLVVDAALTVDQRDRFDFGGDVFEVTGLPKDFNHGPFGFSPDRLVVELGRVG